MSGNPVKIGPFNDGLNNVSTSGESKDTELVELVNFEVGPDNLLWSRPPFEAVAGTSIAGSTIDANWKVLGVYRTTNTEWYLLVIKPLAAGAAELQAILMGDFTNSPIVIKSLTVGNTVAGFVQINNDCYFVVTPSSSINGFKWALSGSAIDIAAMKKGNCVVAYKSRIWVAGIDTATQSSRLYFSNVGVAGPDPTVWNTDDFFDVAPGEGGFITALLALNSSIIVFKNDGTWRFSYPASPKKGQVDKISGSVGAASSTSVLEFENYVYVYDQGRVYELVNNNYTPLNRFVKFASDPNAVDSLAPGVDLSVLNRRLVVRYFNAMYSYAIDSRAWCQWRSYLGVPGRLYELPADSASTLSSTYIAASQGTTQNVSFNIVPAFTAAQAVYMNAFVGGTNTVTHIGTTITLNTVLASSPSIGYLNPASGNKNYNIRLSGGQQWKLTGNMTKTGGTVVARMTYLLRNGSTSVTDITLDLNAIDKTFTAPDTAISAYLSIRHTITNATDSVSLNAIQLIRQAVDSPASLISVRDDYSDVPVTVEFIDCKMRTKSYDYQQPSTYKRLFWWGADIKTNMIMKAKLIPSAIKAPPTHAQLAAYTHTQLSAGTWGNPLSFLQINLSVSDGGDPTNAVTENGRIFVKLIKSMRFKQASFELELSTLGTKATGPCKIHTITSYVMPKEKVVDKFN
jgi:hypothetical protein